MAASAKSANSWLLVDLGGVYHIRMVAVYARLDIYGMYSLLYWEKCLCSLSCKPLCQVHQLTYAIVLHEDYSKIWNRIQSKSWYIIVSTITQSSHILIRFQGIIVKGICRDINYRRKLLLLNLYDIYVFIPMNKNKQRVELWNSYTQNRDTLSRKEREYKDL